jgi:hypothetical protein
VEEGAEHVPGGSWSRGRACSLEEVGLDDGGGGHRRETDLLDAVLDQIGKDRTWGQPSETHARPMPERDARWERGHCAKSDTSNGNPTVEKRSDRLRVE